MVQKQAPDPNPINASLPWRGDFQLLPNGSIGFVGGVHRLEQRVIRRVLTNPREILANGVLVTSDYLFDQNYGTGATRIIGQPIDPDAIAKLTAKIRAGVIVDEGVDSSQSPEITLFYLNQTLWAKVKCTLIDGNRANISFPLTKGVTAQTG